MQETNYRKVTRSQVWPETEATLTISDVFGQRSRSLLTIKGSVSDLGSSGMFLITPEIVPVPAKAEITINFDPASKQSANLKLTATGEIVRTTPEGVGIKFTSIDLVRLQQCIIFKMNQTV
jgi:hypothetical protein